MPFVSTAATIQDSDGDGLSDQYEAKIGTETYLSDTDGDGINDGIEVGSDLNNPLDTDGDKRINALDYDDDNDGLPTILEVVGVKVSDVDKDGVKNHLDNDSDNDGIADGVEAGYLNIDDNLDGIDDAFDVEHVAGLDKNGDGISDNLKLPDVNKNNIPDYLDPEVSNGPTIIESKVLSKDVAKSDIKKVVPVIDKKAVVNRYTDTDNDGLLDNQEIIFGTNPLKRDSDGDSVSDAVEIGMDINSPQDSDHDNIIDALDPDDDNDGILTKFEDINKDGSPINDDLDDDGVPNYLDGNDDGDDKLTIVEGGTKDTDKDGILDYLDNDDGKIDLSKVVKQKVKKNNGKPEVIVLFDGNLNTANEELYEDSDLDEVSELSEETKSSNLVTAAKQLLNDVTDADEEDQASEKQDSKLSKDTKMTQVKKTGAATWSWTFF